MRGSPYKKKNSIKNCNFCFETRLQKKEANVSFSGAGFSKALWEILL